MDINWWAISFVSILTALFVWKADWLYHKMRLRKSYPTTSFGIVLILACLLVHIFDGSSANNDFHFFIFAFVLLGIVNFLDDLYDINYGWRLIFQFAAGLLALYNVVDLDTPWIVIYLVAFVAFINAYNFMDGINGISGVYSLAILLPQFHLFTNTGILGNYYWTGITFLTALILLNFRLKAKVILGDSGSIALGMLTLFICVENVALSNSSLVLISLYSLYLIDTGVTLLDRIIAGDNVFQRHQKHLYQLLTLHFGLDHRTVALTYGTLQFCINFGILHMLPVSVNQWALPVIFLVQLLLYLVVKTSLKKYISVYSASE